MDILDLLQKCGIKGRPNHQGNILTFCLFHSHHYKSPSMSINVEKKVFYCWNCGAKGHVRKILYHFGVINGYWDTDFKYEDVIKNFDDFIMETEELNNANEAELEGYRYLHPYLLNRGFTKEILRANKIGFDKKSLRVTVPIWFGGKYHGVIKRSVVDDIPKYLYPENLQKSAIVYSPKPVKIVNDDVELWVEGSLDALKAASFGYHSHAILGCKASKMQLRMMNESKRKVILALDADEPGRNGVADILAQTNRLDISILKYPEGVKDLGDISVTQLNEAVKKCNEWHEYVDLSLSW